MAKFERRYSKEEFLDNGYDLFTEFVFEVCKRAGITMFATDDDIEGKIILKAYGDWEKEVE